MSSAGGAVKARAFIAELHPRFDLSSAKTFGEVTPLTEQRELNPTNLDLCWTTFRDRLKAKNFDPAVDFIIQTGHSTMTAVLVAVVIHTWGSAQMLLFDSQASRYRRRMLSPAALASS